MTTNKTPPAPCDERAVDVPQTCDAPVMGEAEMKAIQARLDAVPGGDWRSALGSGHNAMTAVVTDVADGEDDYETIFLCDVIPDYCVEDPQVWANRVPLLTFFENAPADLMSLLASHDALTARLRAAEERERAAKRMEELAIRFLSAVWLDKTQPSPSTHELASEAFDALRDEWSSRLKAEQDATDIAEIAKVCEPEVAALAAKGGTQ